mmetsp:Transcript_38710/g.50707  ORF Transcript_38710/g.50707 Transcript_38710/m.50707 type:complete len:117 (+) Transcript_38710:357-707(+)
MYKEKDLLTATNAYHRLDKCQNVVSNKAFAMTIINDLKQRLRQDEFEKRLGVLDEDGNSTEVSKLCKDASKEHFKKQQSEIYQSSQSLSRAKKVLLVENPSQAEIQNLKEVLHYST